jgi:hypothetical protein
VRRLPANERGAYVQQKAREREAVQKEVRQLQVERDAFLREQTRQAAPGGPGLDEALRGTLREQAKKKGIVIPQ